MANSPPAMLVKLIEMPGKRTVYFDASQVRAVLESDGNPMTCKVMQNWMTQQGFFTVEVLGTQEETARRINAARAGKDLNEN